MSAPFAADSHRVPARELVTPEQLATLRQRQEWKGIALIAHAWAIIFASMALVAVFPNPLTYVLAVMLIGSRQLGLAILMHEGAHRCFSRNEARNMALSQWLCAYAIFADTLAYRRYHLTHHANTQQENDPDLVLSAPFPITKASYRRKFWRDITGKTGYEQRKAQLHNALGDPAWPIARRLRHCRERLGPCAAPRDGPTSSTARRCAGRGPRVPHGDGARQWGHLPALTCCAQKRYRGREIPRPPVPRTSPQRKRIPAPSYVERTPCATI
jgi:Fatty acid desaturase